ncbi:MAG: alpha/beta hydrolase [Ardenticatenales bacterium]|nr:alpha/beta hydrolase [Ardenticatenales bacterium]
MVKKWWLALLLPILVLTACDEIADAYDEYDEDDEAYYDDEAAYDEENFDAEFYDAAEAPAAGSDECPFDEPDDYDLTCGYLSVPENRAVSGSRQIQIAYVIVHADDGDEQPPVVYLAGGPGGSAIDDFVANPEGWEYPFTEERDLVLVDQRGTGYSWPTLDCPELSEDVEFSDENPEVVCHDRLVDEGIDLAAYNSAENAADIAALRIELGYDSWDLLGISYGTRLALTIMRDHPEGIRSVVLDSVFPPNADTPGEEALAPYSSLQRLFADCAEDDYCADEYPDLETVFLETVADMNDEPVDGVFGDDLVFLVTNALNDMSLIPLVPYVIYEVSAGNVDALDDLEAALPATLLLLFQDEADRSDSEGMYNSVICHDEYVFGSFDEAENRAVGAIPEPLEAALLQPVADLFQVCSFWGAGAAGSVENQAVHSDIPTLILAGLYDHATPPAWADLTAQTLGHAYLFKFPDGGHSLLSDHQCAISMTADFLDEPDSAPDDSCLDEIEWPNFE